MTTISNHTNCSPLNSIFYRVTGIMRHDMIRSSIRTISRHRTYSQKSQLTSPTSKQTSRIDRFISRSPKFLHRHLRSLRTAPVTHISAFLILHELTAVVPLFGLAGAFHYYNWLPTYFAEGTWVIAGVERFGRYARRKGWISEVEEQEAEQEVKDGGATRRSGDGGVRWVVEFATAYAIVKAFLVPRLFVSVWAAPPFARWTLIPLLNVFKSLKR